MTTKIVTIVYGINGYDSNLPNNNIVGETVIEIVDGVIEVTENGVKREATLEDKLIIGEV
jgi:hypothetical protein